MSFTDETQKIVATYKDRGERRLARPLALMMAGLVNPSWSGAVDAITYIPATQSAVRRRGFDHGLLLAQEMSKITGIPTLGLLARPQSSDQRALGRTQRQVNMEYAFRINPKATGKIPPEILMIDDVMTTGATMQSACRQLRRKGAQTIHCITFARV